MHVCVCVCCIRTTFFKILYPLLQYNIILNILGKIYSRHNNMKEVRLPINILVTC